jgi:hypothetical protein
MSRELYDLIEDDLTPSRRRTDGRVTAVIAHPIGRWSARGSRERQILSRIARSVPVFVLEEAVHAHDVALGRLDVTMPEPGVWRAVPYLPFDLREDEEESLDRTRHFAQQLIGPSRPLADVFADAVQWFFTPMPAPRMLGAFGGGAVVYDCVDERTWLRLSPLGAAGRERLLVSRADVVFASESAAIRARSSGHSNVQVMAQSNELVTAADRAAPSREARWGELVNSMLAATNRALATGRRALRPVEPSRARGTGGTDGPAPPAPLLPAS